MASERESKCTHRGGHVDDSCQEGTLPPAESKVESLRRQTERCVEQTINVAAGQGYISLEERQDAISAVSQLADYAEELEARVANEIAARRLAQEHGIGDRARIEELEREVERLTSELHEVSGRQAAHTSGAALREGE